MGSRADLPPSRVVVENVEPRADGGRFPVKRTAGEELTVSADVTCDGHEVLAAALRYRRAGDPEWAERDMTPGVNDRWEASFPLTALGHYEYSVQAWIDP